MEIGRWFCRSIGRWCQLYIQCVFERRKNRKRWCQLDINCGRQLWTSKVDVNWTLIQSMCGKCVGVIKHIYMTIPLMIQTYYNFLNISFQQIVPELQISVRIVLMYINKIFEMNINNKILRNKIGLNNITILFYSIFNLQQAFVLFLLYCICT